MFQGAAESALRCRVARPSRRLGRGVRTRSRSPLHISGNGGRCGKRDPRCSAASRFRRRDAQPRWRADRGAAFHLTVPAASTRFHETIDVVGNGGVCGDESASPRWSPRWKPVWSRSWWTSSWSSRLRVHAAISASRCECRAAPNFGASTFGNRIRHVAKASPTVVLIDACGSENGIQIGWWFELDRGPQGGHRRHRRQLRVSLVGTQTSPLGDHPDLIQGSCPSRIAAAQRRNSSSRGQSRRWSQRCVVRCPVSEATDAGT